jgi:PPM family protein phosphatase
VTNQGVSIRVFGRSDIGLVRKNNEDTFVIADLMVDMPIHALSQPIELQIDVRGVLLAVADGMGGEQAGEVASALALHSLRLELPEREGATVEAALTAGVQRANQSVWQVAVDKGLKGMGATLTAVLFHGNRAYVAEVGDSRAYVLRGSSLAQLTRDQSYAQALLDAGAITREQAEAFQYKHVILQAVGTKPSLVVAMNHFSLRRGDRILLCSDGLTGKVNDEEIRNALMTIATLDAACASLIDLANARGGEDNVTVVVAEANGDGLPELTGEERVSLETVREFTG